MIKKIKKGLLNMLRHAWLSTLAVAFLYGLFVSAIYLWNTYGLVLGTGLGTILVLSIVGFVEGFGD